MNLDTQTNETVINYKNMRVFSLIFVLFSSYSLIFSQVSIGSGISPNKGSLLDLKEDDTNGAVNSTKGLLLPRVIISTSEPESGKLSESIGNTGNWDEELHIGLMVYNIETSINACDGGVYEGVYNWNGTKWYPSYKKKLVPPSNEISTDLYDGANSYIVGTNKSLDIPVKRAFDIWNAYLGNDPTTGKVLDKTDVNNLNGTLTTEVVWQDANVISSTSITGSLAAAILTVNTSSLEGNALVRVLINGSVLWQWHIWVTQYNPLDSANPYIVNGNTDWYMDRFLGAKGNSNGGIEAYGLYYQWGRSIPFQKVNSIETIDATSNEKDNLTTAIQSEKFILYYTTETHDWYSATANQWDTRWGDLNNGNTKKSPFDPCPRGWRLPSMIGNKSPWECLDTTTTGGSSSGWNFNEVGRELGYFPSGGYRSNGDGSLGDQDKAGYVWTASPNGKMAGVLFYNASTINIWDAYNRSNAMNVRCLKDK